MLKIRVFISVESFSGPRMMVLEIISVDSLFVIMFVTFIYFCWIKTKLVVSDWENFPSDHFPIVEFFSFLFGIQGWKMYISEKKAFGIFLPDDIDVFNLTTKREKKSKIFFEDLKKVMHNVRREAKGPRRLSEWIWIQDVC